MDAVESADRITAYIGLDLQRIFMGLDHFLCVARLVHISRTRKKRLLITTGFILAYSVTLILAATEVCPIPIRPVAAVNALSIFSCPRESEK